MKKAYDRVEWDFLEACLLKTGFDEIWVRWVMQCVTTVTFSVKFNGEPLQYFQPSRELGQGDPLSPYLFVIVANVLSSLMKQAVDNGSIIRIRLNRLFLTYYLSMIRFFFHEWHHSRMSTSGHDSESILPSC